MIHGHLWPPISSWICGCSISNFLIARLAETALQNSVGSIRPATTVVGIDSPYPRIGKIEGYLLDQSSSRRRQRWVAGRLGTLSDRIAPGQAGGRPLLAGQVWVAGGRPLLAGQVWVPQPSILRLRILTFPLQYCAAYARRRFPSMASRRSLLILVW